MRSTCLNCKKRYVGCHGTCKDYIEAKAEHDKQQLAYKKQQYLNNLFYDSRRRRYASS